MRDTQAITNWRSSASRLLGSEDQAPSSIKTGLLLTVLTWLLSRFIVSVTWGQTRNPLSTNPNSWIRWDSVNYLSIAQHGAYLRELLRVHHSGPTKPVRFPLVRDCAMVAGLSRGSPIGSLDGHRITQCWTSRFVVGDGGRDIPRLVWLGQGYPPGTSVRGPSPLCPLPRSCLQLRSLPNIVGPCRRGWCTLAAIRERFLTAALLMTAAGLCYPTVWTAAIGLAIGLVVAARRRRKGNRYPSGIMGSSRAVIVGFAAIF